jgi:hypothetical protein
MALAVNQRAPGAGAGASICRMSSHKASHRKVSICSQKRARIVEYPPFEGYKGACAVRGKRRDEPPHHDRPNLRSPDACARNGWSVRRAVVAWSAAPRESNAAFGKRHSRGAEHANGYDGQMDGEGAEVRVPVAPV